MQQILDFFSFNIGEIVGIIVFIILLVIQLYFYLVYYRKPYNIIKYLIEKYEAEKSALQ